MENKMAKTNLILNGILIIAVVVLFFFQFSDNDEKADETIDQLNEFSSGQPINIAFVQTDSILTAYQLVQDLSGELEEESRKKDKDFSFKQKAFEQDAAYFQQQVDNQTISNESAQLIYEQLMLKQQELYGLEQQFMNELAVKEMAMQQTILDSLRSKLNVLNENQQFDFILSYNSVSNILLADDAFDITSIVIEKLNEDYQDQD